MNKKLLAIAVGATLAAAPVMATQAKVKLWGRLEVEVVSVNSDNGSTFDGTQQGDTNGQSRWGVDASEDLGNGIKAIGRMAWQIDPSNGSAEKARDQWVGLKGGFGTFKIGRVPSSYKMFGGVKWDPYTATFLQARRSGGMSGGTYGHNGFNSDMVEYTTPKGMGGFKVQLQYSLDKSSNDKDYHAGVSWKGGPVEVIGAASHSDAADATNKKIGARFKSGGMFVFLQYEDVENGGDIRANGNKVGGGASTKMGNFTVVGAGYKFGNNLIAGNVGKFNADTGGGVDVDYYALGLTHFLSKHTRVWAGYSHINAKTVDKVDQYGAGIRFDF
jgi:predicted porin